MKINIIGAGAMGTLFGTKLAMVGNEVTMVDVVPVVLDEINEKGIRLNDENGDLVVLVKAAKAEELTEKAELAILGM